jgi:hypothetical protein
VLDLALDFVAVVVGLDSLLDAHLVVVIVVVCRFFLDHDAVVVFLDRARLRCRQ